MTIRNDFDEQYPPNGSNPLTVEIWAVFLLLGALAWGLCALVFEMNDKSFTAGLEGLDDRQMLLRLTNAGAFDHGGLRLVQEPGSMVGVMSFRGQEYSCSMDVMTTRPTGCRFMD